MFNLISGSNVILTSEAYKDKSSCKSGIYSVQVNSLFDGSYRRKTSVGNHPYFTLVAGNGETIGTSEMYSNELARENGILSVIASGRTTEIEDRS
jgi:uncharacterized protein YegP (UPF0339 family)